MLYRRKYAQRLHFVPIGQPLNTAINSNTHQIDQLIVLFFLLVHIVYKSITIFVLSQEHCLLRADNNSCETHALIFSSDLQY